MTQRFYSITNNFVINSAVLVSNSSLIFYVMVKVFLAFTEANSGNYVFNLELRI